MTDKISCHFHILDFVKLVPMYEAELEKEKVNLILTYSRIIISSIASNIDILASARLIFVCLHMKIVY